MSTTLMSPTSTDPLDRFLHTAIRAARESGRLQLAHVNGDLQIDTKSSDTDLVTHVDKQCEARIREIVAAAHPDHVVLGEEGGQPDGDARHRWIVDPIDGTVNFAHGFPFFCCSVALEIDGRVEIGVVFDPNRDELFVAVRGRGATLNGRPIRVSDETEPKRALLATGFAYVEDTIHENVAVFSRLLPEVRSIRRPGAAALDLCYVACGRVDGFWELKLQPWDVAAGALLVQEAGGAVTGGDGAPYRLDDRVVVASNGALHARLVRLLDLDRALA